MDALRTAWESGADRLIGYGLAGLASVAGARGDAERAALFWAFVEAYAERLQFTLRGRTLYEKQLVGLVGTEVYEAGRRLDVATVVEKALA